MAYWTSLREFGVTGGGTGGGAWPRCGAARNPLWRPRGSVSITESRRSWNRVPGPAAEEPVRGTHPHWLEKPGFSAELGM